MESGGQRGVRVGAGVALLGKMEKKPRDDGFCWILMKRRIFTAV